jgi:hypothetical protein
MRYRVKTASGRVVGDCDDYSATLDLVHATFKDEAHGYMPVIVSRPAGYALFASREDVPHHGRMLGTFEAIR